MIAIAPNREQVHVSVTAGALKEPPTSKGVARAEKRSDPQFRLSPQDDARLTWWLKLLRIDQPSEQFVHCIAAA